MLGYAFRVGPPLLPATKSTLASLITKADRTLDAEASRRARQMLTAPREEQFHPVGLESRVAPIKVNGTTVGDPGLLEDYSGLS